MNVNLARALRLSLVGVFAGFLIGPAAAAQASTADLLLPDLAMLAPFDFKVEITPEGRHLLRFSTVLVNIGRGPFQAYGYDTDGFAAIGDTLKVRQEIKRSDGTWAVRDTGATMTWAGDGHDHWHINRYETFALHRLDGSHIGYVAKIGFCAFDSYVFRSLKPAKYTWGPTCRTAPDGRVPMGTSRNWGDVYRWNIAFQWIDITGLPAGTYRLNVVADGPFGTNGKFRESNETNNRSWARISISGSTVKVLAKSANP